jgi:hypothetical protein
MPQNYRQSVGALIGMDEVKSLETEVGQQIERVLKVFCLPFWPFEGGRAESEAHARIRVLNLPLLTPKRTVSAPPLMEDSRSRAVAEHLACSLMLLEFVPMRSGSQQCVTVAQQ